MLDYLLHTMALYGVLAGAAVVLCAIGILFTKEGDDNEM